MAGFGRTFSSRKSSTVAREQFEVEDEVMTPLVETPGGMSFELNADDFREKESSELEYPERELFIWATLLNRKELAFLFWKAGADHIGGALTACAILKGLSESADEQEELDLSLDLVSNAGIFEDVAVGVLHECYHQDRGMAHKLLVRELTTWGKTTLLDIADSAEEMAFMGHTACQHLLNKIWRGKMALYTSSLKILACLFIPFVIFSIKFSIGEKASKSNTKTKSAKPEGHFLLHHQDSVRSSMFVMTTNDEDDRQDNYQQQYYKVAFCGNPTQHSIRVARALYSYHTAPVVKFCYHTISQVIFLCLFSYFVLSHLHPITEPDSPSGVEITVWVWTATLLVEEIRQFWTREARSLYYKMHGYLSSAWNVMDLIIHFFLAASIVLRFVLSGHEFYWARTCYCITLALYFIRFMQVFYVNKNIGPKVIMIRQMLTDLMFFLCILVVFLLAFGVTSQALRYPNSEQTWVLLKDVVFMPYWQMYGELFLEELQGDVGECSSNKTEWELDPDVQRCPEESRLVVALLALYMILTNVLLLNLLIAMFSHTFQLVQDNSERVWRFYRYGLIHEYFDRPTLAPPLIIFNHIWRLFKYLRRRCAKDPKTSNDFKVVYPPDDPEANQLTIFERAAMERYFFHQRTSQDEQMGVQVTSTKDRIEKVIEELDEIKDRVTGYQPGRTESIWDVHDRFLNDAPTFSYSTPGSLRTSHHSQVDHHFVTSGSSSSGFMEGRIKHLEERMTARQKQLEEKIANQETRLERILEILQQEHSKKTKQTASP